jgi:ferredoxin
VRHDQAITQALESFDEIFRCLRPKPVQIKQDVCVYCDDCLAEGDVDLLRRCDLKADEFPVIQSMHMKILPLKGMLRNTILA